MSNSKWYKSQYYEIKTRQVSKIARKREATINGSVPVKYFFAAVCIANCLSHPKLKNAAMKMIGNLEQVSACQN